MDPYKHLRISLNPDGASLSRPADAPLIPPSTDSSAPALSKDLPLNNKHNTWLRIFLPNPNTAKSRNGKVPVILYFHGGGFIILSADFAFCHSTCADRAAMVPAIFISVDYRLAPEHRLPAAYDDAVDALLWLRDQATGVDPDPWLRDHADFSRCFIMGSSAGANIAYQLALRALDIDVQPLKLAGLILNQPFFGGELRTESEARSEYDSVLPLAAGDLMWELALPIGATRDHEYSNPRNSAAKPRFRELPRCWVKGFIGDPLYDRQKEFVKLMEEGGRSVVALLESRGHHSIDMIDPGKAEEVIEDLRGFIYGSGAGAGRN